MEQKADVGNLQLCIINQINIYNFIWIETKKFTHNKINLFLHINSYFHLFVTYTPCSQAQDWHWVSTTQDDIRYIHHFVFSYHLFFLQC